MTEKATQKTGQNVYTFQVGTRATKYDIKSALEEMYKVKISKVRIVKKVGKSRRSGKRMQTRQLPDRKIAYITVKQGTIDIFPKA